MFPPDFIKIIVPIEYNNNSSQIPTAKGLFYFKTKRIFVNTNCCLFLIHTVYIALAIVTNESLMVGLTPALILFCTTVTTWEDFDAQLSTP